VLAILDNKGDNKEARLSQQQNDLLADWNDYERMEDDVFDTWDAIGEEE